MNKAVVWTVGIVAVILALGYAYQQGPEANGIHTVEMTNNKGESIGTIDLTETRAGVMMNVKLSGLEPNNEHAIHIHEKGDCTPAGSFTNAGGHFNPMSKEHGLKNPEGHHAGDMPNLKPTADGTIDTNILNQSVTMNPQDTDGRASVFDADGSAIVIHMGADDHVSQPSGDAGGRFACGVIK